MGVYILAGNVQFHKQLLLPTSWAGQLRSGGVRVAVGRGAGRWCSPSEPGGGGLALTTVAPTPVWRPHPQARAAAGCPLCLQKGLPPAASPP